MDNLIFALSSSVVLSQFWSLLRFVAATGFVAFLAYYATRKIANANTIGQKSKNVSVVETINLGGQAAVKLVKAGDKYLVLGVTKERVSLLSEIDKEHITEAEVIKFSALDTPFGKVFSRFIKLPTENETQENDDE
ncbi:MAG: flagellar biosynthetic protein FliO [Defluviitaleaceae bacterium]|nr:flagellar biosynthetic protein FliO [Defluviitaleaceae bacterium]